MSMLKQLMQTYQHNCKNHDLSPPAVGIAVLDNGKWEFQVTGSRDIEASGDKVTINDSWHLGSCGKSFTAALILHFVNEGIFDLNHSVQGYLPNIKLPKEVTISQLLTHSSGISNETPSALIETLKDSAVAGPDSRTKLVEILSSESEMWADSQGVFNYCNWGYCLLGHLIDKHIGPFEEVLMETLVKPLGLSSIGFGAPSFNSPKGHWHESGKLQAIEPGPFADNHVCLSPAGRIHLTLEDWSKWIDYLLQRRPSSLFLENRVFESVGSVPYTLGGFSVSEDSRGIEYWHNGSNHLWFSSLSILPRQDKALLVATNWGGVDLKSWVNDSLTEKFKELALL